VDTTLQSAGLEAAVPESGLLGFGGLRHLFTGWQKYYNEARTHLSLHPEAPMALTIRTVGSHAGNGSSGRTAPPMLQSAK
jgi:hypothetical protein